MSAANPISGTARSTTVEVRTKSECDALEKVTKEFADLIPLIENLKKTWPQRCIGKEFCDLILRHFSPMQQAVNQLTADAGQCHLLSLNNCLVTRCLVDATAVPILIEHWRTAYDATTRFVTYAQNWTSMRSASSELQNSDVGLSAEIGEALQTLSLAVPLLINQIKEPFKDCITGISQNLNVDGTLLSSYPGNIVTAGYALRTAHNFTVLPTSLEWEWDIKESCQMLDDLTKCLSSQILELRSIRNAWEKSHKCLADPNVVYYCYKDLRKGMSNLAKQENELPSAKGRDYGLVTACLADTQANRCLILTLTKIKLSIDDFIDSAKEKSDKADDSSRKSAVYTAQHLKIRTIGDSLDSLLNDLPLVISLINEPFKDPLIPGVNRVVRIGPHTLPIAAGNAIAAGAFARGQLRLTRQQLKKYMDQVRVI